MDIRKSSRLIITNCQNEVLLFKYSDEHQQPFWSTPGGELVGDESYLEAAQRELYEETGLTVKVGRFLRKREAVYAVSRSVPAIWKERYYHVEYNNKALYPAKWTDEEKSTITKVKWWSLEALLSSNEPIKPEWIPDLVKELLDALKKGAYSTLYN